MMTSTSRATPESQIRRLIDNWAVALRSKNIEVLMSHYTPDILLYDLAPPLLHKGAHAYRESWEEWLGTFQGGLGYEVHNLSVTTGNEVAFSTSLNRISGLRTDGEQTDVWVRATIGYRRIDGKWRVAHEHFSVPFYMDGSERAATDLKP